MLDASWLALRHWVDAISDRRERPEAAEPTAEAFEPVEGERVPLHVRAGDLPAVARVGVSIVGYGFATQAIEVDGLVSVHVDAYGPSGHHRTVTFDADELVKVIS